MPLVAAKCTQCGANIEVNPSHDAGICPHCGTAYVTEKVIKNYITNNNLNVGAVNIDKVNVSVPDHIEKVVKSYSAYMKKKEYEKADQLIRDELELDSADAVLNLLAHHFSMSCYEQERPEWDHNHYFYTRHTYCDAVTEYKKFIGDLKNGRTDVVEPKAPDRIANRFACHTIYKYYEVIRELSAKERTKCSQIADEVQQEIDAERQLDKLKKEADVLFAPLKQKLAKKEQEQQAKKKRKIAILIAVGVALFMIFGVVINVVASQVSP